MNHLDLIIQRRNRLEEEEENEQPRQIRELLDRSNPLEDYSDYDFQKFYRLSKRSVLDLTEIVTPLLERSNNRGLPLSPLQQVRLV
jgi:hypothetical protein